MKCIVYSINKDGLNEIKAFLAENHKLGGEHFSRDMLQSWASDAEFQLGEGNPATITISSWDSIHGRTQELTVSSAGLDLEEIEIDE